MNIFTATMPIWIGVLVIVAVLLLAIAGWLKSWETAWNAARKEVRLFKQRDEARTQRDNLNTENKGLHIDLVAKIAECEKWQGLYGELLDTYNNAQGDAHATVPLVEVTHVPTTIAEASVEKAAPVKRTRKKAGAQ